MSFFLLSIFTVDMFYGSKMFYNLLYSFKVCLSARFGSTYTKIGTIQRRLAWPLRKDDTQIREAFHIFETGAYYTE